MARAVLIVVRRREAAAPQIDPGRGRRFDDATFALGGAIAPA